jgi:NTE family protein
MIRQEAKVSCLFLWILVTSSINLFSIVVSLTCTAAKHQQARRLLGFFPFQGLGALRRISFVGKPLANFQRLVVRRLPLWTLYINNLFKLLCFILCIMRMFTFLLLISISLPPANAQQHDYKNLVLEGGGVRGFAYAGALEVLDSLGILQNIERVGGTSVGAIQATLLALGYTPKEIMEVAANIPLKEFNDGFFPGGFSRLSKKFGFYKGEKLTAWAENLIAAKTSDTNITFLQLHELRGKNNYKDLYITGTDLTHRCLRVFSYESYPNMRIKDALRISFSIPLYFQPVLIDDEGKVQNNKADGNYHLMVDGGLLSNYPIQIFDSTKYISGDTINNIYRLNKYTLGLLLDKPEQLEYTQRGTYPLPIHSLNEYVGAVYQTIIDKPNPDVDTLKRTVTISHLNLSGRVRKLSTATTQKLLESGRYGVRLFFLNNELQSSMQASATK